MDEGDQTNDQQSDQQQQDTTQQSDSQQTTQQTQDRTVPYTRFKEVNDRVRAMEQQIADLSKSAGDADAIKAQLADANTSNLRMRVALATGLPHELASRLQGKDEAEMTADATALLKLIPKKAAAPNIDGDQGNTQKPTFTRAQISDYAFYQKNRDAIMQAQREGRISD